MKENRKNGDCKKGKKEYREDYKKIEGWKDEKWWRRGEENRMLNRERWKWEKDRYWEVKMDNEKKNRGWIKKKKRR